MAYVAAVAAANLAVEGVEDVTRYGLTIPFTRWLFAYKAGLAAEDLLSIPESREIGDDQAEREALIGQFGARTQMRDTYYPNLASFVELHVANMWPYQQGVMTKFLWVPDWWRYPPLIYQLDALWRAYENASRAR